MSECVLDSADRGCDCGERTEVVKNPGSPSNGLVRRTVMAEVQLQLRSGIRPRLEAGYGGCWRVLGSRLGRGVGCLALLVCGFGGRLEK
jgi:hypothetical protein